MKTAFLVDSTGTLSTDLLNHENVFQVTLSSTFPDGTSYTDTRDDKKTIEFYKKMSASKELPKTSQPEPAQFIEAFDQIKAAGFDNVIVVVLSSQISGTFQTAQMIAQDYEDDFDTYFIDSKGASLVIESIVEQGLTLMDHGLDIETVCEKLRWVADESDIFLMVEDLKNLSKGGRLSKGESLVGNLLNIKPILIIDSEGLVKPYEKVRTTKRALKRLNELIDEKMQKYDNNAKICFAHANEEAKVMKQIEKLQVKYPETIFRADFLSIIIGTHTGEGAVGFGVIPYADVY